MQTATPVQEKCSQRGAGVEGLNQETALYPLTVLHHLPAHSLLTQGTEVTLHYFLEVHGLLRLSMSTGPADWMGNSRVTGQDGGW